MPLLRLLSAAFLVSTALLQAAAQAPKPTPAPSPLITPQPSAIFVTPKLSNIKPLITIEPTVSQQSSVLLTSPTNPLRPQILTAQNSPSCYTMRTYGFKAKDLESPNPRPSSYTECTSTASASIKDVQVVSTTQTVPTK
jgi:hypothetical protein